MTLTKRGSIYHYDATLGPRRVRCSLGTRDPKSAERLANRVSFALADGPKSPVWSELKSALPLASFERLSEGLLPPKPLKLTELEQKFYDHNLLREKLGQIGPLSRRNYDRTTKLFFDRALEAGFKTIHDLTPEFVQSHLLWRKESILAKGGSGRGMATDVVILSALFKFAIDEGWLARSPLKYKPKLPAVEEMVRPFTSEEIKALDAIEKTSTELLAYTIFRDTGLRCSDVCNLLWKAVDWKAKTLCLITAKRGTRVEIPLTSELYKRLDDSHISADIGRVFPNLTNHKIYRMMKNLGERAKVPNVHPHRWRHSFVCTLLSRGATLFDVSRLIGDTAATTDKHYAKWTQRQADRVRELMEK